MDITSGDPTGSSRNMGTRSQGSDRPGLHGSTRSQLADQEFLDAHPQNRIYNGEYIYHKQHYPLSERAQKRNIHDIRYFRFRKPKTRYADVIVLDCNPVPAFELVESELFSTHDGPRLSLRGGAGETDDQYQNNDESQDNESEGEDFDPAEPSPKRKMKEVLVKKRLRKGKARLEEVQLSSSKYRSSLDIEGELAKHGIDLANANTALFKLCIAVKKHGLTEKQQDTKPYTPRLDHARRVQDLPPWKPDERLYELVESAVSLVPHTQPDSTTTRRWKLLVRNTKDPLAKDIELFLLPAVVFDGKPCVLCSRDGARCSIKYVESDFESCRRCVKQGKAQECIDSQQLPRNRFATMTEEVCQDKALVIALGLIAADIMNSSPFDLNTPAWELNHKRSMQTYTQIVSSEQCFVETVSLCEWKTKHWNSFDLASLPTLNHLPVRDFNGSPWSTTWYSQPLQIKPYRKGSLSSISYPGIFVTDLAQQYSNAFRADGKGLNLHLTQIDHDVVDATEPPSNDYHIFGVHEAIPNDGDDGDDAAALILRGKKILRICIYQLTGIVGTLRAIKDAYTDLKARFQKDKSPAEAGPYRNRVLFSFKARSNQFDLLIPNQVLEDLETRTQEHITELLTEKIALKTTDLPSVAWIAQQGLNALAQGKGTVEVLFATHVAVERVQSGTMTTEDVVRDYCSCDGDAAAVTEHYCMQCRTIRICANMIREETEKGTLIKCIGCGDRSRANVFQPIPEDIPQDIPEDIQDNEPATTRLELFRSHLEALKAAGFSGKTLQLTMEAINRKLAKHDRKFDRWEVVGLVDRLEEEGAFTINAGTGPP